MMSLAPHTKNRCSRTCLSSAACCLSPPCYPTAHETGPSAEVCVNLAPSMLQGPFPLKAPLVASGHSIPWISFPPRQKGWERPLGLLQQSPCPMGQTLHLEDLHRVMLSDSGPWEEDPGPDDKMARAVQAAAGSRQRCPGGLIGPDGHQYPCELPMGVEQLCSRCPWQIQRGAAPGPPRGVSEAPSAAAQASVTHGVRTGSSAGPGSPGRQQQSEIYSTKQPENKPEECLLFFLCGREIKHDCLSPGNAGISTHGSSAEIASAAGHSQP